MGHVVGGIKASKYIQCRQLCIGANAVPQIYGEAQVAGPQRILALTVLRERALGCIDAMHRESTRSFEPHLLTGACMQLEKRVPGADSTMTQHWKLRRGAGAPHQFTGGDNSASIGSPASRLAIHAITPGAPLQN